jgi:hypothetical protein
VKQIDISLEGGVSAMGRIDLVRRKGSNEECSVKAHYFVSSE